MAERAYLSTSEEEAPGDDEIVQEYNVYLSKGLNGKLCLLQYPVLSSKRNYGSRDREIAKIKPQNNKLEIDISLDVSSPNYDQSKGEQIALNVDGNDANQAPTLFSTNVMDKQTFQSTTVPSKGKRYVCGMVNNGNIHLTPISHVFQLRPSFKYMDQAEQRAVKAAKAKEAAEADSSQDEADDAKAVTLRVKGAETEAVRLARERSYAAHEKRLADEKWRRLRMHSKTGSFSERDRQKLICQSADIQDANFEMIVPDVVPTPTEYLTKLAPVYSEHSIDNTVLPSNVLSLSHLKNKGLGDQLKLIMKNVKIIHFGHLQSLLPSPADASIIVRSLQSFAVLVRGCWVVKSEVLFPPQTTSPISGTPAEHLCRSRDYILYMFTRREYLARKEVTGTVKIPGDDVKAILEDISTMRKGHGWCLRLSPDYEFTSQFPEVCERQGMLWNALGAKLAKQMNLTELIKEIGNVSMEQSRSPPTTRKKKSSSSADEKTGGIKSPKAGSKRQRKSSGHKSSRTTVKTEIKSPVRNAVKSEPMSPPVAMPTSNLTHTNSVTPTRITIPSPEGQTALPPVNVVLSPVPQPFIVDPNSNAQKSPIFISSNTASVLPQINIEGVNSTVQSVANEIIKNGSPNANPQYYIPQTNISLQSKTSADSSANGGSDDVKENQN